MRIPGTLLLLLLPAPIVVVVAASFTPDGYLRFPPGAMSLRWYAEALSDSRWLRALGLSLWIAALTRVDITVAYPMLSMGYVIAAFAAWQLFGEQLSTMRLLGIGTILVGVVILARA